MTWYVRDADGEEVVVTGPVPRVGDAVSLGNKSGPVIEVITIVSKIFKGSDRADSQIQVRVRWPVIPKP